MASVQKRVSKAGLEYGPDRTLCCLAEQNELSGDALTVEQLARDN
ncbi:hypothetical protein GCM10009668_20490 [Nocardioides dubius]|uniref:Uncharacterized protein n=1 Tax=Nocardioides dubius TaxID=317019 RepID=A0ABP4EBZ2_9ACTN